LSKKKKKSEPDEVKPVVVNRSLGFSSRFKEDLALWFKQDFQKASKILDLIAAVMEDPFDGIGKPEPLKYMDADIWSRRIDLEHRLIYRVGNTQIDFLACRYHCQKPHA
jgi:toxin YoeB